MMSSGEGGGSGDFDLNLAPIIDCFTVLITYLLVSASFISLCVFDVGVAATGEAPPTASAPKEPPYSLSLVVQASEGVEIKLTGGPKSISEVISVPAKSGAVDTLVVIQKLKDLHAHYPSVKDATIAGEPTVKYKEVMRVIETLKIVYPKVFIGG